MVSKQILPDLDRLCIFEDLLEGESLAAGVGFFSTEEAMIDSDDLTPLEDEMVQRASTNLMQISMSVSMRTAMNRAVVGNYEGVVANTGQQYPRV